jgi:methionyl-tRNA formyltransferase
LKSKQHETFSKMKIIFMGTPAAAVPTLKRCVEDGHEVLAVWTQPDRPAGRGNKIHVQPVKEFAVANKIEVHQPTKIKTEEAAKTFSSYNADVAVVVAYGRILSKAFLSAPKRGCVNVHFSLLPKYRGAAPVNWAIANGETVTGITTMFMDEGLDTGDILLQKETTIGDDETAPDLLLRLAEIGAELLSETLKRFDEITPRKQDDSQATFAPILKREDGLIDWNWNANKIANRVRGFQPFPNSHTSFNSKHLTVWSAKAENIENNKASAGEIITARSGDLIVACGERTALRLIEIQLEGKKRMSVRDFINGSHIKVGDKFG